jgi:hypothetical protein
MVSRSVQNRHAGRALMESRSPCLANLLIDRHGEDRLLHALRDPTLAD